ncbi:putative diacylglycerol O-acyltransferase tgs1, partial [Cryomyces antarcticus]
KIAEHVATAPAVKTVLIDAFAGAGGNTIAFALSGRWERIFAIEKDPEVLQCAKHNAEVYGVANKIWWAQGDCFDIIKKRFASMGKDAVIFASPPWGGPGYTSDEVFNLSTMQPYSLRELYMPFSKITTEFALYLPRTSNLNQLAKYAPQDKELQVTHYCTKGASKVGVPATSTDRTYQVDVAAGYVRILR